MAGSAGDGGSAVAGSVELGGGGAAGSDVTVDAGDEEAMEPIIDAGVDAGDARDAHDAQVEAAPIDAGPKRPIGITMSATSVATARQTPSAGGNTYSDECIQGDGGVGSPYQALVGFKGTVPTFVDGGNTATNLATVQGVCAPLSVSATAPYTVMVGATNLLPIRGVLPNPATAQTVTCPPNQIVVGFQGRQAQYIEALQLRCAPLTISGTSPAFTLAVGAVTIVGPIGAATAGTTFPAIDCPANQVAVAQAPRAGAVIDSFGLVCRAPTLVIQ